MQGGYLRVGVRSASSYSRAGRVSLVVVPVVGETGRPCQRIGLQPCPAEGIGRTLALPHWQWGLMSLCQMLGR